MRFAVTGAAGFIGSHLAEALIADGHEVVGIDCFTDYYDPALKEENARELDVIRLDLAVDELDLAGFDGVFHLAGQPGVRSFGDVFTLYLRRNVLASQRLFAALLREDLPPGASHAIKRRIVVAQALYALGALLCVVSTYASIAFIVAVQLNFAIAPRIPVLSRI